MKILNLKKCCTAIAVVLFAACGADPNATGAISSGPTGMGNNDECPSGQCSGSNLATNELALKGVDCAGDTQEQADAVCNAALTDAMNHGQIQGVCVTPNSGHCSEGACLITVELGCFVHECEVDDECDDGNACTGDFCLSSHTCYNPAAVKDGEACSDGNACTENDMCEAGTCSVSTPKKCSDDNVCNGVETCSPPSGTCLAGVAPMVDDSNVCTTDACNPMTGVSHTPVTDGTSCETDGHACTTQECWAGSCKVTAKDDAICDDGNQCTLNFCSSVDGCVWSSFEGIACGEGMTCQAPAVDAAPVCALTPAG